MQLSTCIGIVKKQAYSEICRLVFALLSAFWHVDTVLQTLSTGKRGVQKIDRASICRFRNWGTGNMIMTHITLSTYTS